MEVETPFDLVNSILTKREPEDDVSLYSPFLTNRSLSYHPDTLPFAVEINSHGTLSDDLQYAYLFHSVKKMQRKRGKWFKPAKFADVDAVAEYHQTTPKKAAQLMKLLSDDDLNKIRESLSKGG